MAMWANYREGVLFTPTGGTVGEGNPTFEFSHCVIVDHDNYYGIYGKASVSDVNFKTYQGTLPPDVNAGKPQFYFVKCTKKEYSTEYKGKVNKKTPTELELFLCERLATFAHTPESIADCDQESFKTIGLALNIDFGANAVELLNCLNTTTYQGQPLETAEQINYVESQIIDYPKMMFSAFTLEQLQEAVAKNAKPYDSKASFSNGASGGSYAKVNQSEQKLTLLKEILHKELCDPKVTPSPADVKLSQVANDLTAIEAKKLENLKYLLGLIFN